MRNILCRLGVHRGIEYPVRKAEDIDGVVVALAHPHAFLQCRCGARPGHWFVRRRWRLERS